MTLLHVQFEALVRLINVWYLYQIRAPLLTNAGPVVLEEKVRLGVVVQEVVRGLVLHETAVLLYVPLP